MSAESGVFYGSCRCVDPATGRARSKRQTVAPDGATGLFLAGGRRPPVRAQACGVMVEAGRSQAPLPDGLRAPRGGGRCGRRRGKGKAVACGRSVKLVPLQMSSRSVGFGPASPIIAILKRQIREVHRRDIAADVAGRVCLFGRRSPGLACRRGALCVNRLLNWVSHRYPAFRELGRNSILVPTLSGVRRLSRCGAPPAIDRIGP